MTHQYFILILPSAEFPDRFYDCDPETHGEYGNEYDSYDEAHAALIAAGYEPGEIAPQGYLGLTVNTAPLV